MSNSTISIVGNVVDDVVIKPTMSGVPKVSFRVASTQRRFDRETGQWVDGHKLFVSVTFWREFAENVAVSLKKGDPIIVHGKIYSRQYVKEETNRVSYEVEPESIGHDLSRGVSKFERRKRGFSGTVELDEQGMPAPVDDEAYELAEDEAIEADAQQDRTLVAAG
jgi:single-strand DNA-binding protein